MDWLGTSSRHEKSEQNLFLGRSIGIIPWALHRKFMCQMYVLRNGLVSVIPGKMNLGFML